MQHGGEMCGGVNTS